VETLQHVISALRHGAEDIVMLMQSLQALLAELQEESSFVCRDRQRLATWVRELAKGGPAGTEEKAKVKEELAASALKATGGIHERKRMVTKLDLESNETKLDLESNETKLDLESNETKLDLESKETKLEWMETNLESTVACVLNLLALLVQQYQF
jgi:hypothetical protein